MRNSSFLRFFAVSVAGVVIDIGLVLALNWFIGVPLRPAATAGFVVAASFNYELHEKWSFGDRTSPLSGQRLLAFVSVSVIVLGVRLAVLTGLGAFLPATPAWNAFALVTAVGLSYLANFGISRWLIFRRGGVSRRP